LVHQLVQMKEDSMAGEPGSPKQSRPFLLQVWQQDGGWRGRLLDLASGEACSFAGWQELIAVLLGSHAHSQLGPCAQEVSDVEDEDQPFAVLLSAAETGQASGFTLS
jgi:hypothetical protein